MQLVPTHVWPIALAYLHTFDIQFWDSIVIDSIPHVWKSLYDKLYPHRQSTDSCGYLLAVDLKTSFSFGLWNFTCSPTISMFGYLGDNFCAIDNVIYTLEAALHTYFQTSPQAILIIQEYGMSLYGPDGFFYLFDSHSRNGEGYLQYNGNTVLVIVDSLTGLCHHMQHLVCTLTDKPLETAF